ncbi:MAG TPA: LLM class flavin-dependent oxidoreductase [Candidatus Sulfomarinibacteraceae bacterium]|nr:LLM class flavin-dependent oxidoreductase [Candidatus Sulfomarinibacteraceae bacterium]
MAATIGRPLRVGIQLPEVEREVRWPEYLAMARRAEELGFDTLWLGDHLLYRYPDGSARGPWEAWTMLSALAASTSRIRLGPLVAATAFHAPAMLAKMAATVDEVSGGRLVLGLGAGWNETEFRAFGFPFDHRVDRFEEAFTIIRTLLRDGAVDFDGRYFQARDCELLPRPARPGGPPLLIGSRGERMLRIALPHVDAWNVWFTDTRNSPAGVPPLRDLVDGICREVGRDPASVERTVAVQVRLTGGRGRVGGDYGKSDVEPLAGTPETIADGLRAYARGGIAEVQVVLDPITLASLDEFARVLELLDEAA